MERHFLLHFPRVYVLLVKSFCHYIALIPFFFQTNNRGSTRSLILFICLMGVSLHLNVRLCSNISELPNTVCMLQRSSLFSPERCCYRKKLRSSLLALLLPINLIACASWLNDFVQTKFNLYPTLQAVRVDRELDCVEETNGGEFQLKGDILSCFVLYSHIFLAKRPLELIFGKQHNY